ncbi:hypothetical protein KBD59_02250 [Candidatus Gracilibacteria bacterium]|nr:hypothetical protein [Candidatus Gracilibacteria bacterium]
MIIVVIAAAVYFAPSILGNAKLPKDQKIRDVENICLAFRRDIDIENSVTLFSFKCDQQPKEIHSLPQEGFYESLKTSGITVMDSIISFTCPNIKIENDGQNPLVVLTENRVCSEFGPCTESRGEEDDCHWGKQVYSINSKGEFKLQP